MTTFGWDASHYDGKITKARVVRAMGEGIAFATHKFGEGGTYVDPLAGVNLNAMNDAGLKAIGAYYVPRTPGVSIAGQVGHCIALADQLIPWWRAHPGFFWQDDVELWDYDAVSAATGKAFGRALAAASGKMVALYASTGMYGGQVADWPGIWWNANYGANQAGPFRDVYQGDGFRGWAATGGRQPDILQYGSKTTIAGLTTCDANAFRGTLDELLALINPGGTDMALDAGDANVVWYTKNLPSKTPTMTPATALLATFNNVGDANGKLDLLIASQAGQDKAIAAQTLAIQALATAGGVDASPILAAIADVKAAETAAFAGLLTENRDLKARLAAALTAAGNAMEDDTPHG